MIKSVYLILLILIFGIYAEKTPTVKTKYGKIAGKYEKSYEGRTYAKYEGVPYAQPPLGKLRFSEPKEMDPWDGVWAANMSTACIQITHAPEGGYLVGEEDCLYLNIYVPKTKKEKLDVIVHIHGGAFMFGSGNYYAGPDFLMDRDVILVTLNYRLGPFGFLSTEDEVLPGNIGMKDQVAALRWVKENIKNFGGNDESITISGLSAGGASVHYHFLSPLSKGLFHRGISASGNSLCNWALQENELGKAKKLANLVGCPTEDSKTIIECLRQRPARQITEAVKQFRVWYYNPYSPFAVNIDRHSKTPFLPEHPYKILTSGKAQDLPWLASLTSEEGLYPAAEFVVSDKLLFYLKQNWEKLAPHILHYNYTIPESQRATVARKIKEYYLKDKAINQRTFNEIVQLIGDRLFVVDGEKSARIQAKVNKAPVYFYYFSYDGEEKPSLASLWGSNFKYGVSHGDDITYVFLSGESFRKMSKNEKKMKNIMLDLYISFAKTGVPKVNDIDWKRVKTSSKLNYLHIKSPDNMVLEEAEELGHRSFWDSLKFEENENLFPTLKTEL